VLLDGRIVDACLVLGVEADGLEVRTVEGLARPDGTLSALQAAFLDKGAVQCGFCIPGQLVSAQALLDEHPHPSRDEIEEGLAGNLCRCACYEQIFEAVEAAAAGGPSDIDATPLAHATGARDTGSRSVEEGLDQ
jgi:carbon-monoxide dehydrogenase small subunit